MANQDLLGFLVRVIIEYYNYIILSNVPTRKLAIYFMALTVGIEPTTYGLQIRCTTIVLRQHLLAVTVELESTPVDYETTILPLYYITIKCHLERSYLSHQTQWKVLRTLGAS